MLRDIIRTCEVMPLYFQYEEEGSGREVAWLMVTLQRLRNDWPLPKHTPHIDWPPPNRNVSFYWLLPIFSLLAGCSEAALSLNLFVDKLKQSLDAASAKPFWRRPLNYMSCN